MGVFYASFTKHADFVDCVKVTVRGGTIIGMTPIRLENTVQLRMRAKMLGRRRYASFCQTPTLLAALAMLAGCQAPYACGDGCGPGYASLQHPAACQAGQSSQPFEPPLMSPGGFSGQAAAGFAFLPVPMYEPPPPATPAAGIAPPLGNMPPAPMPSAPMPPGALTPEPAPGETPEIPEGMEDLDQPAEPPPTSRITQTAYSPNNPLR